MSQMLSLLALLASLGAEARVCDAILDCGAVADNKTNAALALTRCAVDCAPNAVLLFPPGASFLSGSIDFSDSVNLTLSFGAGAGLFGSGDPLAYPVQLALPFQGTNVTQWRALVYARNVTGLTIQGPASARIDGCGWPWWANFSEGRLAHQRPKLVEIVDAQDVALVGMTFANSAFWTLHPIFATRVLVAGVSVLAPRSVGNTDGIDPNSCVDCVIRDCLVDVGDDGISVKSGQHDITGELLPSANILIENTTVLSRNVAIGSACFGGVTNVTMRGGRIGDDHGSSPWAIKLKTHVPNGGITAGIAFENVTLGNIAPNSWQQPHGGTAVIIALSQYGGGREGEGGMAARQAAAIAARGGAVPAPTQISNVSFIGVAALGAVTAGSIEASHPFKVHGLTFADVRFAKSGSGWECVGVLPNSSIVEGTNVPPIPEPCR
jgi:polygalacturonase